MLPCPCEPEREPPQLAGSEAPGSRTSAHVGYSSFSQPGSGEAVLSWLCCALGGSPASQRLGAGGLALPCCGGAKYIRLGQKITAWRNRQGGLWDGGGRGAAWPCLRRAGGDRVVGRQSGPFPGGWGGHCGWWRGMAGAPQAIPPPFPSPGRAARGWGGDGTGLPLPGLSALFSGIYRAPFPALFSFIHSFVPATALKHICGGSDSIPLLQGHLVAGVPVGIWHLYSRAGLRQPFPAPSRGCGGMRGAQPSPSQRRGHGLRLFLLNKPRAGSSADVRPWKYLYEGPEPARCSPRRWGWEEGCSLPTPTRCSHLWPAPAALPGHGR